MKIQILIPTFNAESTLSSLLDGLKKYHSNILIIDSTSTDRTVSIAQLNNINVIKIKKSDFNHGSTREKYRKFTTSDIVIYFTQDAIPVDHDIIEKLIKPLIEGRASVAYGRQIPRNEANILEAFPRLFSYGSESQIRSIKDVEKYGVHTFFCSNSCAAYLNKDLNEIGGFKATLTNEDYFAAAELLKNGKNIAYVPNAQVIHSHSYSLIDEFQRYFDTGYVRSENPWIQQIVGNAEHRGRKYFIELIKLIIKKYPLLFPYAILQTGVKYIGYKTGFNALQFPLWLKKILSGQKYFWNSKYYYLNDRTS